MRIIKKDLFCLLTVSIAKKEEEVEFNAVIWECVWEFSEIVFLRKLHKRTEEIRIGQCKGFYIEH